MATSRKPRKKQPQKHGKLRQQQNDLVKLVEDIDSHVLPIITQVGVAADTVKHALEVSSKELPETERQEIEQFVKTTQTDAVEFAENICQAREVLMTQAKSKISRKNAEQYREFQVAGFSAISDIQQHTDNLHGYHRQALTKAKEYLEKLNQEDAK